MLARMHHSALPEHAPALLRPSRSLHPVVYTWGKRLGQKLEAKGLCFNHLSRTYPATATSLGFFSNT